MAYLSRDQLNECGFKHLGRNVRISDRAAIYNADQIEIGDNTCIDDFCVLSGRVTIGRNVRVAIFCNLMGGIKGVTLSDFSGLSSGCQVFSQSVDFSGKTMGNSTVPAKYRADIKEAVHIGRHCIIGIYSVISPGVTLAEGCSVGAMSLVLKSTEPWGVYVGIPARRIKDRKRDLLALEKAYLRESGIIGESKIDPEISGEQQGRSKPYTGESQ